MENMNTGFIAQEPRETDYIAGSISGIQPLNHPTGNWFNSLPSDERQSGVYFDSMACVSFSAINVIETQMNWMLQTNQFPPSTLKAMEDLGYIKDGVVNFSDRYIAKLSGTTRKGNYLVNVWDAIRKYGLIAENDWTYDPLQRSPVFDWDDYYAPIPQALLDKGQKFLGLFEVKYEWLLAGGQVTPKFMKEWLKGGPVQIASATCPGWSTGIVSSCSLATNHATMIYGVDDTGYKLFDQYAPFSKTLALDYKIPYAMRAVVTVKSTIPKAVIDPAFGKKFAGDIILAVEDRGSTWYITKSGKRAKIGVKPDEVSEFLQAINDKRVPVVGMKNSDLSKIDVV